MRRWHWVEDDNEVVLFVGSEAQCRGYYKKCGGFKADVHLMSAFKEGNEDVEPPKVGKKWGH